MNILDIIVKLFLPSVHKKLARLAVPLTFYFYDWFTSFFATAFSSDIVLRLWDMIVFNLSTNQLANRKRGLWYLLATCIYMLQLNQEAILKALTP